MTRLTDSDRSVWLEVETLPCDFSVDHFWDVMRSWLKDPEIVTKTILRGEILSEKEVPGPDGTSGLCIHRRLLPRLPKKDTPVEERILFCTAKNGEARVEHVPLVEWDAPETARIPDSLKLPFFYPKVLSFAYVYTPSLSPNVSPTISIQVIPLPRQPELLSSPTLVWNLRALILKLAKHGRGFSIGYEKRVHHDQIVPKVVYQDTYLRLKDKYSFWADNWTEGTDPQKYVFEDISIAAFLIAMWEADMESTKDSNVKRRPTFVDLGCGNGLLTHILTQEGYTGFGIDLARRKLWSQFEGTDLRAETIFPKTQAYPGVDWIIGNHPDELTLWIPIIAARSGYSTKFMIIPCCFHELSGARVTAYDAAVGRYESYVRQTEDMVRECGYEPEREALRIPSTKNKAIIGRKRTINTEDDLEEHLDHLANVCFTPRISDQEKNRIRIARAEAREELDKNPRSLDEQEMSLFSEFSGLDLDDD